MTPLTTPVDSQGIPHQRNQAAERRTPFRQDIQALRAIAIVLVVLYHAHVPGIRGGYVGVDVFFVISGFLISGKLIAEAASGGRISFTRFYAGRVRRLLPPALLVIVVTLAVARLVLPPLQTGHVATHALYSALYAINYRLAAEGVDYQQVGAMVSPLQHFWSLAVEEQFYLIWPLLIGLTFLVARRHGRRALLGLFGVILAVSLYASVTVTKHDSSLAYFALQTRAWELAVGAIIALLATSLRRLPARTADVLAWTGLIAIIVSAVLYTDATAFPGSAALLPVAGTALVIIAGGPGRRRGVGAIFDNMLVQGLGKVSYGWYLWHWPAVVLLPLVFGEPFGWIRNLAASALALWFALLSYVWIERPVHLPRLRPARWLAAGALGSAAAVAVSFLISASLPSLTGAGDELHVVSAPAPADNAYLLQVTHTIQGSTHIHTVPRNLTPALAVADQDNPETSHRQHCHANFLEIAQGSCVFGDPHGTHTVALFGDSHMEQWEPAFATAAEREHWRVVSWTKSACPLLDQALRSDSLNRVYTECQTWLEKTIDRLIALKPDLLIVTQSDTVLGQALTDTAYADGTMATLDRFRAAGIKVTYALDTMYPAGDTPVCLSAHLTDATACSTVITTSWVTQRRAVIQQALARHAYPDIDPQPWLCAGTICPALVANLLVYRDAYHLTATYSRWLAPMVEPLLKDGGR